MLGHRRNVFAGIASGERKTNKLCENVHDAPPSSHCLQSVSIIPFCPALPGPLHPVN